MFWITKKTYLTASEKAVKILRNNHPPKLGHDYRVDVEIVVWESKGVLRVPSTALFRTGDRWAAFAIRDGRARLVGVETGPSDLAWTVVKSGLAVGEKVIPQPSDSIKDGTRVEFKNGEEISQWLITEKLISTVPWDDAGSFLRFSVTFAARNASDESRVLDEVKRRLSDVQFQF